jgi:hypothetical protein
VTAESFDSRPLTFKKDILIGSSVLLFWMLGVFLFFFSLNLVLACADVVEARLDGSLARSQWDK